MRRWNTPAPFLLKKFLFPPKADPPAAEDFLLSRVY
jgi:hypothetical protein